MVKLSDLRWPFYSAMQAPLLLSACRVPVAIPDKKLEDRQSAPELLPSNVQRYQHLDTVYDIESNVPIQMLANIFPKNRKRLSTFRPTVAILFFDGCRFEEKCLL